MRTSLLLAGLVALGGFMGSAPAVADQGCDPAVMHFYKADGLATTRMGFAKLADMCWQAADSNSDGMVDKDEWNTHFDNAFSSMDQDQDGSVSDAEIQNLQSRE